MSDATRPSITPSPNGPYIVKQLTTLTSRKGDLEPRETMALCRCGGSANKPFCDGTHKKNGFSSAKIEGRVADRRDSYAGAQVTVHDNRGICSHAGHCTDKLASVFRMKQEPWIDPSGAPAEEIVAAVRRCPSGALSYSIGGVEHRDRDAAPAIAVAPDGPYEVTGGPELLDTEFGEGASREHYTLCRCGASKNKPFCDGSHWHVGFKDG